MSDILSTFLSSRATSKRSKNSKDYLNKSNRIFLNNGLRLSKDTNIIKLNKFRFNSGNITEQNLNGNIYSKIINENKLNEVNVLKTESFLNNPENDIIFKNKYLNNLNNFNNQKLYPPQQIDKNNFNNNNKYNNNNKKRENIKSNNSTKRKERNQFIEQYIDDLLKNGKKKFDKFENAVKKRDNSKYLLEKSISPTKYIEQNIYDENFNYDDFKTSNIQKDCFNGNENFRKANYKNIRINIKNNIFLNEMKAEPEDNGMKDKIEKMIADQKHLNKFNFGKYLFNRKVE